MWSIKTVGRVCSWNTLPTSMILHWVFLGVQDVIPLCRANMPLLHGEILDKEVPGFLLWNFMIWSTIHVGRHTNKVNYASHLETVVRLHSCPAGPVQHTGNESLWPSFAASKGPILYLCSQKIGFLEGFGSDVAVVCLRSWVELHTGDGGKALSA